MESLLLVGPPPWREETVRSNRFGQACSVGSSAMSELTANSQLRFKMGLPRPHRHLRRC